MSYISIIIFIYWCKFDVEKEMLSQLLKIYFCDISHFVIYQECFSATVFFNLMITFFIEQTEEMIVSSKYLLLLILISVDKTLSYVKNIYFT